MNQSVQLNCYRFLAAFSGGRFGVVPMRHGRGGREVAKGKEVQKREKSPCHRVDPSRGVHRGVSKKWMVYNGKPY